MGQLLQNLIGNALKFHHNEPTAHSQSLGHSPPRSESTLRKNGKRNPQQCRIYVEDNGIGFDEAYLPQLFQPFQRLVGRGEYEGTGMGLSICKKIVERHGGDITARSIPGQGTTFMITLPVSANKSGDHPMAQRGRSILILMADDDAEDRMMMADAFARESSRHSPPVRRRWRATDGLPVSPRFVYRPASAPRPGLILARPQYAQKRWVEGLARDQKRSTLRHIPSRDPDDLKSRAGRLSLL